MNAVKMANAHIAKSIERALRGESYLDPDVLEIKGFATPTMRHLFSNLCHIKDLVYLEIGAHCGASFVSAFNNNPIHAIGIDDFTQPFNEPDFRQQLADNLNRWKDTAKKVDFYDTDCWKLDRDLLPWVDVFYYDGEHSYASQARALPAFVEQMSPNFIYIVDDFQWDDVKRGTEDGLKALHPYIKIEQEWHLQGEDGRNDHPIWWNGLAIYLISKVKSL